MIRKFVLVTFLILSGSAFAGDILGTWSLDEFYTEKNGVQTEFCHGATGLITYVPGYMSVGINCPDGKILFYSGPMEFDGKEVVHHVRNFSSPDLKKDFRRKVTMPDENHLELTGELGAGEKVTVTFTRVEKHTSRRTQITGVYELAATENHVDGIPGTVPFCQGYFGTILFTGNNYASVSINCGKKPTDGTFEPAAQFGRKYFYNGTYKIEGNKVIVIPSQVSVESQIGAPVERAMKLEGDVLTLEGVNGSAFVAKWKRILK